MSDAFVIYFLYVENREKKDTIFLIHKIDDDMVYGVVCLVQCDVFCPASRDYAVSVVLLLYATVSLARSLSLLLRVISCVLNVEFIINLTLMMHTLTNLVECFLCVCVSFRNVVG